jgi:[FeFe] hydrogenase H-cluster maturation GTPase HydF
VLAVKETGLKKTLEQMGKKPALVITDSQVFASVSADVPEEIPLTSFSILMARYKGYLETAVKGVSAVETLRDGDKVLISEGCTHHRQCDDIGSVKIPRWLRKYTGKNLQIELSAGREFPEDLSPYSLVIHCGGCMLNEREVRYRMKCAVDQKIPFTNYGITIAYMQGILKRSVGIFPDLAAMI